MSFSPPKVFPGSVVVWTTVPGEPGLPAIVTKLRNRQGSMLDLAVFSGRTLMAQTGVRHESDPALLKQETSGDGAWAQGEHDRQIEARLAYLESAVTALRKTSK